MPSVKKRIVFHVDMDQFFAAVEEKIHPDIKGKPVVVGANPKEGKGRGVVSTSNYEARKYGVRSGMPISKAWKLCPRAVYLPVNYDLYTEVSSRIMTVLRQYSEEFEPWGLDEAFLDVSNQIGDYQEAVKLAHEIKRKIYEKEGLTCSIGIGPNKLVAKIASAIQKPNGLTVVEEENVKAFLTPLPVGKMLWVGRKTEQKLRALGIETIGDLANYNPFVLTEKFGAMGTQLHLYAQGIDRSEVEQRTEAKSIGRHFTFEEDTSDINQINKLLDSLSREVHKEITTNTLLFKAVTITVRYESFETHTHSKTLPFLTNRLEDFQKAVHELIQPYLQSGRKVRLIGVRVSSLVSAEKQKTLI
jgi:DNA polymerase IV (DinB-like DNA polymerase)